MLSKKGLYSALLFIILCIVLLLPSVNRDLHYVDELRYVEVAREMTETGEWLVPHFGGRIYADKPPVYFWVLNLSKYFFGDYTTLAMVLPSIISSIIICLLTLYFSSMITNKKNSLLASLVLVTSFMFFGLSIFVRMDMLMTIFITASLLAFFIGYRSRESGKEKYYLLSFLFMGLATVIKGPAGFLDPIVVILGFLIFEKNLKELKKMRLLRGFSLFLGVILLWIVPAVITGGREYAYQLLIVQTLGRSVDSFAHQSPIYYYLINFPLVFLPWSFFLGAGFIYYLQKRKKLSSDIKFLLAWFWMPLLLFSFFSGKIIIYLLPITPAAALIVADFINRVLANKNDRKYLVVPTLFTIILFILTAALASFKTVEGVSLLPILWPAVGAIAILVVICLGAIIKKRDSYIPYLLVMMIFILLLNLSVSLFPAASDFYTKRPISRKIVSYQKEGVDNIIAYQYGQPESLTVYTGFMIHNIGGRQQLIDYLVNHSNVLILMPEKGWNQLKDVFDDTDLPGIRKMVYSSNGYILVLQQ